VTLTQKGGLSDSLVESRRLGTLALPPEALLNSNESMVIGMFKNEPEYALTLCWAPECGLTDGVLWTGQYCSHIRRDLGTVRLRIVAFCVPPSGGSRFDGLNPARAFFTVI
jgi:hypothetical protein